MPASAIGSFQIAAYARESANPLVATASRLGRGCKESPKPNQKYISVYILFRRGSQPSKIVFASFGERYSTP